MAKRPPQNKTKFIDDSLTSALAQLTLINESCDNVLGVMWEAIMAMVVVPATATYEFTYEGKAYEATLSVYQWTQISAAINNNDEVLVTVLGLLSGLTKRLSEFACGLVDTINGDWRKLDVSTKSPLGCCAFNGQQQPLTQLQCSQYTMSTWDPSDPNCTNRPHSKGR